MKVRILLVALVAVATIACSDDLSDCSESFLGQNYHSFVVGVLTPDEFREYAQEVFVGSIHCSNTNAPPTPLGDDELVNRVLLTMRAHYLAEIRSRADAEVSISDEYGNTVQLEHVGNGFYRDVDYKLHVKALNTYHLRVEYDGESFTGSTTVPGPFEITNTFENDTLRSFLHQIEGRPKPTPFWRLDHTASEGAVFYRYEIYKSSLGFTIIDNTFVNDGLLLSYLFKNDVEAVSSSVRAEAVDSNFANMYHSGGTSIATNEWFAWHDEQTRKPLHERSNIEGLGTPVGVFGSSQQAAKVNFVVLPPE